jgi:hypothetical protein
VQLHSTLLLSLRQIFHGEAMLKTQFIAANEKFAGGDTISDFGCVIAPDSI